MAASATGRARRACCRSRLGGGCLRAPLPAQDVVAAAHTARRAAGDRAQPASAGRARARARAAAAPGNGAGARARCPRGGGHSQAGRRPGRGPARACARRRSPAAARTLSWPAGCAGPAAAAATGAAAAPGPARRPRLARVRAGVARARGLSLTLTQGARTRPQGAQRPPQLYDPLFRCLRL